MTQYCGTQFQADTGGSADPACTCLLFPQLASAYCADHTECGLQEDGLCRIRTMSQAQGIGGSVQVYEFSACNPYPCWLAECRDPNALITSSLSALMRAPGACAGLCIDDVHASVVNLPPLPPGASYPNVDVNEITQCGLALPPYIVGAGGSFTAALNSYLSFPLLLVNDGDQGTEVNLASCSVPWAGINPPANIYIPPRSHRTLALTLDEPSAVATVTVPRGGVTTVPVTTVFAYPDVTGAGSQYASVTTYINLTAPQAATLVATQVVPFWFWILLALTFVVVVGAAIFAETRRRGL
jgi:hypothetical protein